jgi:anti-sigma factor RsiW
MITCRELVELLCDFVCDELSSEQRHMVEQHLCNCPPCVVYLETYQVTIRLTRQLPPAPMPDALIERLRAVLEEVRNNPPAEGE